jgi:hypothetical protein
MSYVTDLNNDPNNLRYIDTNNLIEYIFTGFHSPLAIDQKRELIARHGKPRRTALTTKVEKGGCIVDFGPPSFEMQIIHKFRMDEKATNESASR